jgi:hypothetical protein
MQPGREMTFQQVERHYVDQLRLPLESREHLGREAGGPSRSRTRL